MYSISKVFNDRRDECGLEYLGITPTNQQNIKESLGLSPAVLSVSNYIKFSCRNSLISKVG